MSQPKPAVGFGLPVRIDIATGHKLPPTDLDPYSLPWVQGAASTVSRAVRAKYASQVTDLKEKLELLARKRRPLSDYEDAIYGPRRRSPGYASLADRPLPSWPNTWDEE